MQGIVCAVLLLITMAVADEATTCTVVVPENKTMYGFLTDRIDTDCVLSRQVVVFNESAHATTTEEVRLAFKRFCDKQSDITLCMDASRTDAGVCLGDVEKTKFSLHVELIQTSLEVGCVRDGEGMAIVEGGTQRRFNQEDEGVKDVFSQCKLQAMAKYDKIVSTPEEDQDPNVEMKREYHVLKDARKCLEELRGQSYDDVVEAGVEHWSGVMDNMKCIDSQHRTYVLCRTLIDN